MGAEIPPVSLKTSLILAFVFMVIASFAFFDPWKERQQASKEREARVFWLKDKKAESLKITYNGQTMQFACAEASGCALDSTSNWNLTAPVADRADPATVGGLLSSTENLNQNEKFELEEGGDPKEFGLDAPVAQLELHIKGEAEPYLLKVGKDSAVGPSVYIQTNREPKRAYLVPNYYTQMLKKDLFHWRNKRLFSSATPDLVAQLDWSGNKQHFTAQKKGSAWNFTAPVEARANAMVVEGLVSTVIYATTKTIFSETRDSSEAKKILAGKPEWVIGFADAKGEWQRLRLFRSPKGISELIAAADGQSFLANVDASEFTRFGKPLLEYRERRLLEPGELSSTNEIALSFPKENKKIVLKAEGSADWVYLSGDKPEPLSRARLRALVQALGSAQASGFLPIKASSNPSIAHFATRPADLELELRTNGQLVHKLRFAVFNREAVLTEGESPTELKSYGADLTKVLPIRLQDLYESTNKQVVVSEKAEADGKHSPDEHAH